PQDIEWALDADGLWLLQSRPITTLPTGRLRVWDNANIAESYGGVTTPLTFSFARRAYAAVYRSFCELLGVPETRLSTEAEVFGEMLGLIRGRVYYNLASWYRVLTMLPGYRLNARFMEGMMGVRDGIPDEIRPAPSSGSRWRDALSLAGSALGLVRAALGLGRRRRAFLARLNEALAPVDLDAMDLDALAAHYRDLESALLKRWDAPIVNDFFAMIAFGIAKGVAEKWLPPGLFGHLLSGDGDIISAEPARRIRAMGAAISETTAEALTSGDEARLGAAMTADPDLARDLEDYLAQFGDRCLEELKLESPTLADDPTPLHHAIAAARRLPATHDPAALRADAERQMAEALRGHPLRRLVFGRALGLARRRVRDRENLRFERTRVFGRARRIVLAMGDRLTEAGHLRAPRDVFYLEIGELLGAVDGTGTAHDLASVADARRREFDAYRDGEPPPDRFSTRGAVATSALIPAISHGAMESLDGDVRQGLGCCAGVVEGPVRVVRDPRGVTLEPGTVLVAERTDPGWVLLFPMCAGLVVERGSLLSHSAIVAREMGIPAAVSVPGATDWLRDGDRVRLDGATGTVTRLDA
ncbi:MAG: PEP-utilizing enzyme, partial [Bacteroidota bacterium]